METYPAHYRMLNRIPGLGPLRHQHHLPSRDNQKCLQTAQCQVTLVEANNHRVTRFYHIQLFIHAQPQKLAKNKMEADISVLCKLQLRW
jgi:hypothetical protein